MCISKNFYDISKSTYDFKYFVMKGISYVDKLTSVELLISSIFASSLWALQAETPRSSRVPGIVLSKINPNDPEINIPFFRWKRNSNVEIHYVFQFTFFEIIT